MAKHGRNATANPVYSSFERAKDKANGKYGTQKRRGATEAVQAFDCCHLSSQAAKSPVITPGGYLFDKENILENLLTQRRDIKRKQKEFEIQKRKYDAEQVKAEEDKKKKAAADFIVKERTVSATEGNHFVQKKVELSQAGKMLAMNKETIQTEAGRVVPKLPAFWLPSLTPGAAPTEIKAPSSKTLCPMSSAPLRIKDLITVNFTLADRHSTASIVAREERYVCAITQKVLRNCIPCVVLKPSGRVITKEAFDRLVKPDMVDPISGEKLKAKDIIPMKSGGTGYAAGGATVKKLRTSVLMVA